MSGELVSMRWSERLGFHTISASGTLASRASMPQFTKLPLYLGAHFIPLLALLPQVEVNAACWIVCGALYVARMIIITMGYHRYFSHRSFKTSRVFQFLLAFGSQMSLQKGVLWWASHHRHHHKHSDEDNDVHSYVKRGFWYSHLGWIFDPDSKTKHQPINDFSKFAELRFIDKYHWIPPIMLAGVVYLALGWGGVLIGFFLSTVLLWHGTYFINSLCHVVGHQNFEVSDTSRNNLFLALLTMGEGWHNNHHHYQLSARQGFSPRQIDITWYCLWVLEKLRIVWDVRRPTEEMIRISKAGVKLDRPYWEPKAPGPGVG